MTGRRADPGGPPLPVSEIGRVFREEYGRAVSVLAGVFGDVGIAEDAVQDAFTAAVRRWPSAGLPPSPAGSIITTARNRAIDRLRLIFTCCHPALSAAAQVALTLRLLGGLTTAEIARAVRGHLLRRRGRTGEAAAAYTTAIAAARNAAERAFLERSREALGA